MEYNNDTSEMKPVTCGVPQGYILGTLSFLLYVNELTSYQSVYILLFLVMIPMYLSGNDSDVSSEVMNKELCKLFKWLKANKLSLNVKKNIIFYYDLNIILYLL